MSAIQRHIRFTFFYTAITRKAVLMLRSFPEIWEFVRQQLEFQDAIETWAILKLPEFQCRVRVLCGLIFSVSCVNILVHFSAQFDSGILEYCHV